MIATEYEEQIAFIQYLSLKGLTYFHIPNSTYTKSFNQKRRNKALGVVPGPPDLFVIIPNKIVLGIEMKRVKGSTTSPNQKEFQKILTDAGLPTYICKGCDAAIDIVEQYLT